MFRRELSSAECADLSDGLVSALSAARVRPLVDRRPHPAAFLARLRFGSLPIMAVGRTIWWPNARQDFAGTADMAVLQHELQHILDFADGRLTVLGYLLLPGNWRYHWELSERLSWHRLGAEQRASMAEALWRAERSATESEVAATLRAIIPWARLRGLSGAHPMADAGRSSPSAPCRKADSGGAATKRHETPYSDSQVTRTFGCDLVRPGRSVTVRSGRPGGLTPRSAEPPRNGD
jgi:hypothetical protein